MVSLHNHLTRLLSVSWLSTIQRERVDRCIHIISLIGKKIDLISFFRMSFLADRRGLIHFLRSSHSSISETTNRSRRTSRSTTSDRRHSTDCLQEVQDHSQDMEHKRVIDSFVVINSIS